MKWNYSTPSLDYLWLNLILAGRKTKPYFNKCHKTSEIPGAGTCGFLLAFQQTHLLGYTGMIKELHPCILLPQNQAKVGFQLHSETACSRGPIHVTSWLWLPPTGSISSHQLLQRVTTWSFVQVLSKWKKLPLFFSFICLKKKIIHCHFHVYTFTVSEKNMGFYESEAKKYLAFYVLVIFPGPTAPQSSQCAGSGLNQEGK